MNSSKGLISSQSSYGWQKMRFVALKFFFWLHALSELFTLAEGVPKGGLQGPLVHCV